MFELTTALAELPELLDVLLVDGVAELLGRNPEVLQHRRDREERPQKRVALHAELKVAAVSRFARDLEARQREDADVLIEDLLARP